MTDLYSKGSTPKF